MERELDGRNEFVKTLARGRDATLRAVRSSAAEEKAARQRAEAARRRMQSASDEADRRTAGPLWARGRAGKAVWRIVAFRLWRVAWSKSIPALRDEADRAGREMVREVALWKHRRSQRMRLSTAAAAFLAAGKRCSGFVRLPGTIREEAKAAMLRLRALKGTRRGDREALVACAETLAGIVEKWHELERLSAITAPRTPRPAASEPAAASLKERIYLPIPYAMGKYATAAGARYDHDAPRGSKWYVPVNQPLAKFQRFLPLAYREAPPALTFPPVRHGASNQNLWSLFDSMTWDSIRHINYERTGRRCALCGKQSGNLVRVLEEDGGRRLGTVDCHEIWDWSVPDPETSVGIQRLRGLLVLCFECHMCFHEGFARSAARPRGMELDVRRFLMKRREFLTRMDPVQIATQMKAEAARLRQHADVKLWLVDLSHLGRQDYMRQVHPVFVESNVPGVKPGQIAGLSFVTDTGQHWPAVSARNLHASVADLYRTLPPEGFLSRLRSR